MADGAKNVVTLASAFHCVFRNRKRKSLNVVGVYGRSLPGARGSEKPLFEAVLAGDYLRRRLDNTLIART